MSDWARAKALALDGRMEPATVLIKALLQRRAPMFGKDGTMLPDAAAAMDATLEHVKTKGLTCGEGYQLVGARNTGRRTFAARKPIQVKR